ncbi:hypothetical protein ACQRKX_001771 [Enterobacter cloacae]
MAKKSKNVNHGRNNWCPVQNSFSGSDSHSIVAESKMYLDNHPVRIHSDFKMYHV